ncbi:hypothetical protein [Peterkaempfera sp. SMS 1(5)a]|uniref:hypothetical protein n=1 Tax=Peterkaempfera podocarpi TaxID=3232308 RepID=UPI00366F456E
MAGTRKIQVGRKGRLALLVGAGAMIAGGVAVATGSSQAAENCGGLDTALQNNLNFIAGQKANPDAQSAARIANRQAVVDQIQARRKAAGCTTDVAAQGAQGAQNAQAGATENCGGLDTALQNNLNFIADQKANPDAQSAARIANRQAVVDQIQARRKAAGCTTDTAAQGAQGAQGAQNAQAAAGGDQASTPPAAAAGGADQSGAAPGAAAGSAAGQAAGDVVCPGSTVTLSGEGGAPAASSSQFPAGTMLRVTNLDNNKSTTVQVTSVSGSCVLLNNAAFEQVREAGKFLIRHARIERVG